MDHLPLTTIPGDCYLVIATAIHAGHDLRPEIAAADDARRGDSYA